MSWREELLARFPALARIEQPLFVVGGAIRDLVAQREPADVDVACKDPMAAAREISSRVIRLGTEEHLSAWRVISGGHVYDFAPLLDGSIARDLARRDFTVNAMAVDLAENAFLDPHGGTADIAARLVRMVDPVNFDDDPLRALKGVRMAVRYGMEIEQATLEAIRSRAGSITAVAPERVTYELSIIFSSQQLRNAIALLDASGLAAALGLAVPELFADEVSEAATWAILVSDPRSYGERWRWSETLIREATTLASLADSHDRVALYDAGERIARQLPGLLRALGRNESLDWPDFSIRPLLNGDEIARLRGIDPGPLVGRLKRQLLEAQIRGEVGTREEAVAVAVAKAGLPPSTP